MEATSHWGEDSRFAHYETDVSYRHYAEPEHRFISQVPRVGPTRGVHALRAGATQLKYGYGKRQIHGARVFLMTPARDSRSRSATSAATSRACWSGRRLRPARGARTCSSPGLTSRSTTSRPPSPARSATQPAWIGTRSGARQKIQSPPSPSPSTPNPEPRTQVLEAPELQDALLLGTVLEVSPPPVLVSLRRSCAGAKGLGGHGGAALGGALQARVPPAVRGRRRPL
jgi:hypothetical protein